MSIRYFPNKRFGSPNEYVTDAGLQKMSSGRAIVEPETIGQAELITADVLSALTAIPAGIPVIYIQSETITVPAYSSVQLAGSPVSPAGTNATSVVAVVQHSLFFYFSAYVEMVPGIYGALVPSIKIVAHNVTSASRDLSGLFTLAVFNNTAVAIQPESPNATLVVTPRMRWVDDFGVSLNQPITPGNLELSARPEITIRDHSITAIELKSSAFKKYAAENIGKRGVFIVPTTTLIPTGGVAVTLGSIPFIGLFGPIVIVGQLQVVPLFTGFISATNGVTIVTIQARNNSFAALNVFAGTQLKVILLS